MFSALVIKSVDNARQQKERAPRVPREGESEVDDESRLVAQRRSVN